MKVVAFDIRSPIGHFRKPDTTATQLTYPFIPPTAAKGLVGAILGIEDFVTTDLVGVQILSRVEMVSQQLSLLGKGGGTVFNRPTTIQLLIKPAYRIFYGGTEHVDALETYLREDRAVYPTYLGSAYALTKPEYVNTWEAQEMNINNPLFLSSKAVVPVSMIEKLELVEGYNYQRANGMMHKYLGQRTFEKSLDFIYEQTGREIKFKVKAEAKESKDIKFVAMESEIICLV